MARNTWRGFRYSARCQDPACDWELLDAKNGLGVAAQHCDRTGHDVYVDVSGTVYYSQGDVRPTTRVFPGD